MHQDVLHGTAVRTLASLPTRCCMPRRWWRSMSSDVKRPVETSNECSRRPRDERRLARKAAKTENTSDIWTRPCRPPYERKPHSSSTMDAVEKRKNMAILERMQTKLDFVRNPRFTVPNQTTNGKAKLDEDLPDPDENSLKSCFDIVPKPPIVFTDYDIGGIYEQVVYVRNTGSLSRRARLLPPGSIFFSMASVRFPEESGLVAPGMHIELRLRFAPDSRADYKDSFTVQYETEQLVAAGSTGTPGAARSAEMVVPLMAHREPPELTLPLLVRAQNTLVGGRSATPLVFKNLGGKARFWLLSELAWARLEHLQVASHGLSPTRSAVDMLGGDYTLGSAMDVGPFRVTPNSMEMDKGESVTFDLVYTPSGVGEQRERFVMVCDNCLVRVFQIIGRGCQVDIAAMRVNGALIDTTITEMGPLDRVFFPDEVLVNAATCQTFVIANDTPVDVKFSWKIHPLVEEGRTESVSGGKDNAMVLSLSSGSTPPFRISPETGVFTVSSSKEFIVEFLPIEARTHAYQATLMINDVPACSMPGPGQMAHLRAAFEAQDGAPLSRRAAAKAAARKLKDAMPGFSIQLRSRGRLGSFTILPALCGSWIPLEDDGLQRPGKDGSEDAHLLLPQRTYSTVVLLKNQSDTRVAFRWDLGRLQQRHLAQDGGPASSTLQQRWANPRVSRGRLTVVPACSVWGLPAPLDFEVTSNHKGLILSYELVQAPTSTKLSSRREGRRTDTSLPKSPKEIERGIPLSDCGLEPETNPLRSVPKLAFGDSVSLGERRAMRLLIRNVSGIETLVHLEAKTFPAAAVIPSLLTGISTIGSLSRQDSRPSTSPVLPKNIW